MAPRPAASALPTPPPAPAPARVSLTPGRFGSGLALTLAADAPFAIETRAEEAALSAVLRLAEPGRTWDLPSLAALPADPVLGRAEPSQEPGGVLRLRWPWRYRAPHDLQIDGPAQARLVVSTRFTETQERALARGVVYRTEYSADGMSPLTVRSLLVDPAEPGVRLELACAHDPETRRPTRRPVSRLVAETGAVAGVNGGYFAASGAATGLLLADLEWIAQPFANRTALAWGPGAPPWIEAADWPLRLETAGGERYDVDAFNAPRGLNRLACYTERWGASTKQTGGFEVQCEPDGRVRALGAADSKVPLGGYVLSAHGQAAEWLKRVATPGARLGFLNPYPTLWPGARWALGAGPRLLENGQVTLTDAAERFQPDIREGRAPRTAVGLLADGRWLIAVADGRSPRRSRGLTLRELASWLKDHGAVEALNLDGGGSSALAIGGTLVNEPSDGFERPVANALVIHAAFDLSEPSAQN